MTLLKKLAIILVMALLPLAASATGEENTAKQLDMVIGLPQLSSNKPIMIIRFNRTHVYYKAPLQRLIEEVQDIKPSASFEVLSLIPPVVDKKAGALAEFNGNKIVDAMVADGISKDRIRLVVQNDANVQTNEVHLLAY